MCRYSDKFSLASFLTSKKQLPLDPDLLVIASTTAIFQNSWPADSTCFYSAYSVKYFHHSSVYWHTMMGKHFRNQHNFVVEAKPSHITIDSFLLSIGLTPDVLFPQDITDASENTCILLQLPHLW